MKQMHRLMVTSDTYKLASEAGPETRRGQHQGRSRPTPTCGASACSAEAEPIWDSILSAAGNLDTCRGRTVVRHQPCPALDAAVPGRAGHGIARTNRRAAYMIRGFSTSRDVMPEFPAGVRRG